MFIVIAILIFGALIAVHELGHFAAAKKLGVRVNEFNIGMGPKLWKRQRGETLYTIRLLPFGGSCVMEGEDEETYVAEEAGGGDAPEPTAAHQDYAAWRVSGRTHEEYVEKFGEPYSPPGNRPSLAEWKAAGRSLREYADIYGNPYIKSGDRRKSQMSSPVGRSEALSGQAASADAFPARAQAGAERREASPTGRLIDPRSFTAQARWKRAVILVAGAFMNLVFGVIILFILALTIKTGEISSAKLAYVYPQSTFADLIQEGDKIRSVNGHRVFYYSDFSMFLALPESADGVIDLVISRGGEKIRYGDLKLERTYIEELGGEYFGFVFENTEMTFGEKLKYTAYSTYNDVRLIGMSLQMLFTGQASLRDLSGPVGIVEIINEQGQKEHTTASGETYVVPLSVRLYNVFSLAALIAVNLAVMNLLPLPGLDGGRVAGLIITFCVEKIIRRKLNPKYEGYVHAAGLILLLGLMAFVLVSDVLKIVR